MSDGRQAQAFELRPTGRLDGDSCASLRRLLASAFAAGVELVSVDLRAVTSFDLIGLGVLAGAAKHLRKRGGGLVVTHAGPAIVTSMRINGMGDVLRLAVLPALRMVPGSGIDGPQGRPRMLSVVPAEGLKQPG